MFISRFLHIKAEEERIEMARAAATERRERARAEAIAEGRALGIAEAEGRAKGRAEGISEGRVVGIAEGIALGRTEAHRAWDEWLARMQAAQRDGKPFEEPPPSSR